MKKLLLLGAGHANLQVLRDLASNTPTGWELNLIDENLIYTYSGGVPSWISGVANLQDIQIDIKNLCREAGVSFTHGKVVKVDDIDKSVVLEDGKKLSFDLLVINVGSKSLRISPLGDFRAIYVKPFEDFANNWREIERTCNFCFAHSFAVVGGGAAGIEIAAALKTRFQIRKGFQSTVTLFTNGELYFSHNSYGKGEKLRRIVEDAGIKVVAPVKIKEAKDGYLISQDGCPLSERFDKVFLLTSGVAPDWIRNSGLPVGRDGYLVVNEYLEAGKNIFGAGDCVNLNGPNDKRSGVRAVKHGRTLAVNIRKMMLGQTDLIPYEPKKKELNILFMGTKSGVLIWGNKIIFGNWPLVLKRIIDRRYLRKFQSRLPNK